MILYTEIYIESFFNFIVKGYTWVNFFLSLHGLTAGTTTNFSLPVQQKSNMPFKQQLCGIQKVFAKFKNHLIFSHFKQNYAKGDVVSSSTSMNTF